MTINWLVALPLMLAMAGCSEGAGNAVDDAEPQRTAVGGSPGISAAYLAGPWCYLHYQAGKERSEEMIDYVFNEDGTLLYQNNPTTPVDRSGVWTFEDGELSVGPSLWVISTRVHSVERNRFVIGHEHVHAVFARGACQREATP